MVRFHSLTVFLGIDYSLRMIEDGKDSRLVQGQCSIVKPGLFVAKPTEIETSIWVSIVQLPTP